MFTIAVRPCSTDDSDTLAWLGACASAPPLTAIAFYLLLTTFRGLDSHRYDELYIAVFTGSLLLALAGLAGAIAHLWQAPRASAAAMVLATIASVAWAVVVNFGMILRFAS